MIETKPRRVPCRPHPDDTFYAYCIAGGCHFLKDQDTDEIFIYTDGKHFWKRKR